MIKNDAIAVWIVGPTASGKSTLANHLRSRFQFVLNQDAPFEQVMTAENLPLDFRLHQQPEQQRVSELRTSAAIAAWSDLPAWRIQRNRFLIETTGDKPALLSHEVDLNRAAGYRDIAVLLDCSLDRCLRQNAGRQRVLPSDVLSQCWQAFQDNLKLGVYTSIFESRLLLVSHEMTDGVIGDWLDQQFEIRH